MMPDGPFQGIEATHRLLVKGFRWCNRTSPATVCDVMPGALWVKQPQATYSTSRWWRIRPLTSREIIKEGFVTSVLVYELGGVVFANGAMAPTVRRLRQKVS